MCGGPRLECGRGAEPPPGDGWFAQLALQASNKAKKNQTALPTGIAAALGTSSSATLQLHASGAGCYSAVLGTVKKADGTRFQATAQ